MKYKWALVLLLLPWLSWGQEVSMSANEIKNFKAAVEKVASQTQSLSADFVQTKHMSFMSKPIESKGKLYYKTPQMVAWKYATPFQYAVIFKENKLFINDSGKKSNVNLGNNKLFNKLNKLILGSINGDMFDEKEFGISYFKVGGLSMARFSPKDATLKKYLKFIELYFDKNEVAEVKMIEPSNDYTQINFKNRVSNAKMDASVFTP